MTINEKILDALQKYSNKIKSVLVSYKDIVNNLTSTSTTLPLSAAQGKLLNDKITTLNLNSIALSNGTEIPANADLNNYTTPGVYYSPHSEVTNTLSNVPMTGVGFKLIVMRCGYSGTTYLMQLFIRSTSTSMTTSVWARTTTNAGAWQDWNLLTLTDQNSLFIYAATYAELYDACQKLPTGRTATMFLATAAANAISNNEINGTLKGTISKTNTTTFDFMGMTGTGVYIYTGRITMAASGATVNNIYRTVMPSQSSPLIKRVTYHYDYTVAANANLNITANDFGMSNPSGYTVLAPYGFTTGNSSVVTRSLSTAQTGTNTVYALRNVSSSQQTGTAYLNMTYIRSEALNG